MSDCAIKPTALRCIDDDAISDDSMDEEEGIQHGALCDDFFQCSDFSRSGAVC